MAVGLRVGVTVGLRVGVTVGRRVGVAVGPRVGERDGRKVGVGVLADVPDDDSADVGAVVVPAVVVSVVVDAAVSVWLAEVEAEVPGAVVMVASPVLVSAVAVVAVVIQMLEVMSDGRSWQAVKAISKNAKIDRRRMKPFLVRPARLNLRISLIRALANGLPQLS